MKNNKGFTLIELVLVLGLIGIVLSMIFSPIIFSVQNFGTQNEKASITSDLRTTMDHLTRQIRKANVVDVVDANTIEIDSKVYTIQGRNLTKDGIVVISGIDKLIVNRDGKGIKIKVVIMDSKGKEYSLSSIMNKR